MRKRRIVAAALALGLLLVLLLGLDTRLIVRRYEVESGKLTCGLRMAVLSDLHSCQYGPGQRELLKLVAEQKPDVILLGGDWVDDDFDHRPPELAYKAARGLAELAPTYYVWGNHEIWSGYGEELKEEIAGCGVTVLTGEGVTLGENISLFGIDDPAAGEEAWEAQLEGGRQELEEDRYSILLTHRPERAEEYGGFDLILAGHAHGGQWRLPGLVNGVYAPDQGWFPSYAGGRYELAQGGEMIVGRGLSKESTRVPRFFVRPEIVVVNLVPTEEKSGEIAVLPSPK